VEIMPDHYRSNLLCATSSSSAAAAAIVAVVLLVLLVFFLLVILPLRVLEDGQVAWIDLLPDALDGPRAPGKQLPQLSTAQPELLTLAPQRAHL
jgi:hypothetical protein